MKLIQDLGMQFATEKSKEKRRFGLYECPICLKHIRVDTASVKYGLATKCYSCSSRLKQTRHGETRTRLHNIWKDIRKRTSNKNVKCYEFYGGKGIKVCYEWHIYENFRDWAMTNGYQDNLTIDRIDANGNYEPSNCRWTTRTVQSRNTRKVMVTNTTGYRGISLIKRKSKTAFRASIRVNRVNIHLGYFDCRLAAAYAYDEYVINNNLEHTKNFEN